MNLLSVRILFVLGSILIGYNLGFKDGGITGVLVAGGISLAIIFLEIGMRSISTRGLSSTVFGLILGLIMAKLVGDAVSLIPVPVDTLANTRVILTFIFCYFGIVIGLRVKD